MMMRSRLGLAVTALVLGVLALGVAATLPVDVGHIVFVEPEPAPAWKQRLALVDDALARHEISRAVHEWREAYGSAIATRHWEPLAEVGDRAVRISRVAGGSRLFLAQARDCYLHALSRARTARSTDGLERIAQAFERLGDAENARIARRFVANPS